MRECFGTSKLPFSLFVEMFVIKKLHLTILKTFHKKLSSVLYVRHLLYYPAHDSGL